MSNINFVNITIPGEPFSLDINSISDYFVPISGYTAIIKNKETFRDSNQNPLYTNLLIVEINNRPLSTSNNKFSYKFSHTYAQILPIIKISEGEYNHIATKLASIGGTTYAGGTVQGGRLGTNSLEREVATFLYSLARKYQYTYGLSRTPYSILLTSSAQQAILYGRFSLYPTYEEIRQPYIIGNPNNFFSTSAPVEVTHDWEVLSYIEPVTMQDNYIPLGTILSQYYDAISNNLVYSSLEDLLTTTDNISVNTTVLIKDLNLLLERFDSGSPQSSINSYKIKWSLDRKFYMTTNNTEFYPLVFDYLDFIS